MDANPWAPVVAALGASGLTGFFGWGLDRRRERRQGRSASQDRRKRSYIDLLNASYGVLAEVNVIRAMAEFRSGFGEGLDVLLHVRKPLDVLDVADRLGPPVKAVVMAVHDVWLDGSEESITIANQVLSECNELVGIPLGSQTPRWRSGLRRARSTPEQMELLQAHARRVGELRRQLAALARREVGLPDVDFLAGLESSEPSPGEQG